MIRPEDEQKINEMTVALRLSKEIACILLVSYNDELLRRDVEAEIRRRLEPEEFNFREFRVTEDGYRNLPIMLVDMKPQPGDIFLIFDLKKALPEVLEYLNYRREDFVEHKISAIFWLDEPTLVEIMRKAPDFFAFRSLPAFEFNVDRTQDIIIPGRTTPGEVFIYNSLEELDAKIALREELLKDYLEKRPGDRSTIAGLHNDLGILYYSKSQFTEAEAHCQKALELYREIKNGKGEAIALGNMGMVYYHSSLDKALEYYSQALEIDRRIRDIQGEASDLGNIGRVYQDKGDLKKSLEYYLQALEMHRRIGDARGEGISLGNMGMVYHHKGSLEKAFEYYLKALEIYRRLGDVQGEASQLGNIGLVYQDKGDLDKALEYYLEALEIYRRLGDAQGEANQLNSMGLMYWQRGDLDKALEYYLEALEIYRRLGDVQGEANQLGNIGLVHRAKGDLEKALECYSRALEIHRETGYILGEANNLNNMGFIYWQKGHPQTALNCVKKALSIFISKDMAMYADGSYRNLQEIVRQMDAAGMGLSEEDMREIAELAEKYEKMKNETAGIASGAPVE